MYCHTSSSVQFESGKTRTCSPLRMRPLYRFHSSGRWALGSHPPKSSRKDMMRSFARARSSSRRAPPKAASKPCSAMASSSVVVCRRLRDARGPVSSTTRPASIESCTLATIRRSPSSATRRSRNSMTSGKLWPVSTCMSGKGKRPGRKAFSARRSRTIESLPPLNRRTGRSNSAATSRKMCTASSSRARRLEGALSGTARDSSGVSRRVLHAPAGEHVRHGAEQQLDVVPERPAGHVAVVDLHHLLERDPRRAEDLPVTRHARREVQAASVPGLHPGVLVDDQGPRADEAHLALE